MGRRTARVFSQFNPAVVLSDLPLKLVLSLESVYSSCNVMAHGDAKEGKWRGNWRMKLVASTLHTTSQHGVSSITTADAHTSAASSRLNWRSRRSKWTRPFRRKTKFFLRVCHHISTGLYNHVTEGGGGAKVSKVISKVSVLEVNAVFHIMNRVKYDTKLQIPHIVSPLKSDKYFHLIYI